MCHEYFKPMMCKRKLIEYSQDENDDNLLYLYDRSSSRTTDIVNTFIVTVILLYASFFILHSIQVYTIGGLYTENKL